MLTEGTVLRTVRVKLYHNLLWPKCLSDFALLSFQSWRSVDTIAADFPVACELLLVDILLD